VQASAATAGTVRALLEALRAPGSPEVVRDDGAALLALALGRPRSWVYAHPEARVDAAAAARFAVLCARRARGEPLAYLAGRRAFWTLELELTPATLVPRPETELLVECVLGLHDARTAEVLDLGTGSGAIALALASERPAWRVLGIDIDPAAVDAARANAERLGLPARFAAGDWYAGLGGARFDLVVSNPPYVLADDPCLDGDGLRFEPRRALAAGSDGLQALRAIVAGAPRHLATGGALACEHGATQGEAVRALFVAAGFGSIATLRDLAGLERVTHGRLCGDRGDG
jgi:release factor glutamine methyltransferase